VTEHSSFIIGAGLAGTTLAWQLHFAGARPILFDRFDSASASRVAAGLITPVTGKRMAVSWNWDTVWPAAQDFYRRVESVLGTSFFHPRTAIRLFQSEEERTAFERRRDMLAPYVEPLPTIDVPHPFGGFVMPHAAVLDAKTYLAASHAFFRTIEEDIDPLRDLIIRSDSVSLSRFELEAESVAFCQGYAGRGHPLFPWITFNPTRGDILSLDIPGLVEDRIIHSGGWLARMSDGSYRAGSTYERERLDPIPDATGRAEVERIVRAITDRPFTVVDHRTAVRPTIRESRPVLGLHPFQPRLAYFNGLGSKGSLIAPHYAGQLARAILRTGEVDADVNVAKMPGTPTRHTEQAQIFIRSVVNPGETVVDATAGNGHDTIFLSRLVGPSGKVIAFDIDPQSRIETESRHRANDLPLPAFHPISHAEMERIVPPGIAAAMFNLGYRPGGDHNRTTEPASSVTALTSACRLIRPGGIVTVIAYVGHKGGRAEADAVRAFCNSLSADEFTVTIVSTESEHSPRLYAITKRTEALP
jgi:glycine oxidase